MEFDRRFFACSGNPNLMVRLPQLIQKGLMLLKLCVVATSVAAIASVRGESKEVASPIQEILEDRCIDCHDADEEKGGVNLEGLIDDFDRLGDLELWVKVDAAIAEGKMPPAKKKPLVGSRVKTFASWFEREFVRPGGVQHAGVIHPRRLTREELQNTLEDILHIDLRETVTNSRLHVIPDTIIEKFFAVGVYGASGFSNDAVTLGKEATDIQSFGRCLSLVLARAISDEGSRTHLFGTPTLADSISLDEARLIIGRFGRSAFRRQLTTDEINAFVRVYQKMVVKRSATEAIKSSMLAVLLSPPFLYRFEKSGNGQTPVVGEELAVRLSYFLWSAPPDTTLLELANKGELHNPGILKEQVRRMLADPKRISLAENLGGEWFDYKKLRQHSAVNKRSDKMAGFFRTQYEEALLFFDSIIRYDQSIFSLVDASWGFANPYLSGIYGIKTAKKSLEVENPLPPISIHFRSSSRQVKESRYEYRHTPLELVDLSGTNRGGFITLGSTLSATSTENRTSPIRRGVWVMERILGEQFEQPEDVPDLEETQKKAKEQKLKLSDGEILKMHSSQAGCASCHKYIDPIGFGLEGFDQLGIGRNVIESHQMPNGKSFASPAELKQLLLSDYREQIADNVIRRVLAYALGRKLDPIDRPAIQRIRATIGSNDYRMNTLIEAVILSYPFTHKESQ
jgi:hypothetical protein